MAYIEEEMKKRRGDSFKEEDAETESKRYQDIYDELYKIPEHLRVIIHAYIFSEVNNGADMFGFLSRLTKSLSWKAMYNYQHKC